MKTKSYSSRKQVLLASTVVLASLIGSITASAQTTEAWWRFEEGPAGANVARGGQSDGVFYGAIQDYSGNGFNLSAWSDGGYAGYVYRLTEFGGPVMDGPNNYTDLYSVKNTGGNPAMWTETGTALQSWQPAAFTVEATFKLENGGYKTIVGRDSQGSVTTGDLNLAAMYFQAVPNNGLAIKFSDVSGYWHEAIAPDNSYIGFDFGSDPDGNLAPWYSMAGVSDGSTLSLYLRNVSEQTPWTLIAQTDMTLGGSPDTTLTMGTGDGGDWDAGNFSVGRGLYAGGHGDRAYGYIDEVRLTDGALSTSDLLYVVPEPTSAALALMGLGGLVAAIRRRRNQ